MTFALACAPQTDWRVHAAERRALAQEIVNDLAGRNYDAVVKRFAVEDGGASREAAVQALETALGVLGRPAERAKVGIGEGTGVSVSRLVDRGHALEEKWRGLRTFPEVVWVNFENAGPGFVWVYLPHDPIEGEFPVISLDLHLATDNPRRGMLDTLVPGVEAILGPREP